MLFFLNFKTCLLQFMDVLLFDELLLRSKVKNGKKGEEALRSYPFNVDKKMHPVARGLVEG